MLTYDSLVEPFRERLAQGSVEPLLGPEVRPQELLAFLIHFCAYGVQMTEPVESWIRRAGQRCIATGCAAVGQALTVHARHEAGHYLMMIEDLGRLAARWNAACPQAALYAEALLAAAPTAGIRRYVALHETVIASDAPFAQVAIEREIEALSVRLGPRFIAQCRRLLGDSILQDLSFLTEHVAIDAGHTHLNQQLMGRLIGEDDAHVEELAWAGARALEAYAMFLDDCRAAARALVETESAVAAQ